MRLDYLSGGGPVPEDSPLYVERGADSDLFKSIQAGELPYVCNSRQMGKTSLWGRTQKKLTEHNDSYCSVLLDINLLTLGEDCKARQWYYSFISQLNYELKINYELEILNDYGLTQFFAKADQFLPRYSLTIYLQYLRKKSRYQRIIVGIDEIDQVLLFPRDISIDFFKNIRACYQENISNHSSRSSETQIGFVLIGVAAPYDLDRSLRDGTKGTPFNLGVPIDLTGISSEKAVPVLSPGLEGLVSSPGAAIDHIVKLTGGQPFLTQKICHIIKTAARRDASVAEKSVEELISWTTDLIETQIVEGALVKDHGIHFRPIENAIVNDTPDSKESQCGRLFELYECLFNGQSVEDNDIHCIRLCLSGLTYSENGYLHIRSEIYRKVFNRSWIDRQISDLRERSGYLAALRFWEEHDEGDLYLLSGEALNDIEKNITISNLPDKDRRFLSLSQTQARNTAAMQEAEARERLQVVKNQEAEARKRLNIVGKQLEQIQKQEALVREELGIVERRKQTAQRLLWIVGSVTVGTFVLAGIATNQAITASRKEAEVSKSLENKQTEVIQIGKEKEKLEADLEDLREAKKIVENALDEAQSEISAIQGELEEEQKRLDAANNDLSVTQNRLITAESDLTIANADLNEAITATEIARDETIAAQEETEIARFETNKAEQDRQIAQVGTRLERAAVLSLQQLNHDPAGAVSRATKVGFELQKVVKQNDIVNLKDYPAVSPLFALRTILDELWWSQPFWLEPLVLSGHQDEIRRIITSNDGELIATASADSTARVWKSTGEELTILQGHQDYVLDVAFSPNNQILATASRDGTARLWDLSGQELMVLQKHQGAVLSIAFSPDGEQLITSGQDGTARLWDISGQEIMVFKGHQDLVWLAEFSPDGKYVATSSSDKTARIWNVDGTELAILEGHLGIIDHLTFSPDGKLLATSSERDIEPRLWNLSGQEVAVLKGHVGFINSVHFSPDGEKILTTSWDNTARLWNLDGQETTTMSGHKNYVSSAAFTPDGQRIVTSGVDNTVRLWNLDGQELAIFQGHQDSVRDIVVDPKGRYFATASNDTTARIWSFVNEEKNSIIAQFNGQGNIENVDLELGYVVADDSFGEEGFSLWQLNGEKIAVLSDDYPGYIFDMDFSSDGKKIAFTTLGSEPKVWDMDAQNYVTLQGHGEVALAVAFSPNNQYVATASHDKTARIWDLNGQELSRLQGHQDTVSRIAFSPDGEYVATASYDKTVRVWNLQGEQVAVLQSDEPYSGVSRLIFSPDGTKLAVSAPGYEIHIWDINQQRMSGVLQGHQDVITEIRFSPDSQLIATGSKDAEIRVSDLNGRELAIFSSQGYEPRANIFILDIAFTPDNQQILVASGDGLIHRFYIKDMDQLLIDGCQWLEGYLPYLQESLFSHDRYNKFVTARKGCEGLAHRLGDSAEDLTVSNSESMSTVSMTKPEMQIIPASSSYPQFSASSAAFYDRPRLYEQSIAGTQN